MSAAAEGTALGTITLSRDGCPAGQRRWILRDLGGRVLTDVGDDDVGDGDTVLAWLVRRTWGEGARAHRDLLPDGWRVERAEEVTR